MDNFPWADAPTAEASASIIDHLREQPDSLFHKYARAGFAADMLPIMPPDAKLSTESKIPESNRGKAPGVYRKSADDWRGFTGWREYQTTDVDLKRWSLWPGAGIGIATRRVAAVDIDVTDRALADRIEDLATDMLGAAPCRVGHAPKRLLAYRAELPSKMAVEFRNANGARQKLEVLAQGQQFVAEGIHPKTGRPYEWTRDSLLTSGMDGLTAVTAEQVRSFVSAAQEMMQEALAPAGYRLGGAHLNTNAGGDRKSIGDDGLKCDPAMLRAALERLPNDIEDYGEWIGHCHAIKAGFGGAEEFYPAFEAWCLQWPGNTPEEARRVWDSISHSGVGGRYILDRLRQVDRAAAAEVGYEPEQEEFDAVESSVGAKSDAGGSADEGKAKRRLTSVWQSAMQTATPRPYLIKGIVDQLSTGVIFGQANVGKSFVALDMGMHVATGRSWRGLRVTQQAVAYVAAEGAVGFPNRVAAWVKHHRAENVPFLLIPHRVDLRTRNGHVGELIDLLRERQEEAGAKIGWVIVDTLARALGGGDESSSVDMTAVADSMDVIRDAVRTTVHFIGHSGKDQTKGLRGHTAMRGAIDTEIEVRPDRIVNDKQRDMAKAAVLGFRIEAVPLGTDPDGDPITSCVVVPANLTDANDDFGLDLGPIRGKVAGALCELEAEKADSIDGLFDPQGEWLSQSEWAERAGMGDQGVRHSTFRWVKSRLLKSGKIEIDGDRVRILRLEDGE